MHHCETKNNSNNPASGISGGVCVNHLWPVVAGGGGMTKEEALQAIKLLSALESWAMSQSARLPDYVHEDLCKSMEVLERIVLEKP
jgi:hypothetical protein